MKVISKSNIKNSILAIAPDKKEGIYNWGLDNQHPNLVENLISLSVTAKNCSRQVSKALYGKGFGIDVNNIVINDKGQNINDILKIATIELGRHSNIFIRVNYNLNAQITSIQVLPTRDVRVGKKDDGGYTGYYKVSKDWAAREPEARSYHSYNPLKEVIEGQIKAVGIKNYTGQVIHIQTDPTEIYSPSDLNTVLGEALSQYNSQTFRVKGSEDGYINTKVLVTQPFESEEQKRKFLKTMESSRGVHNSSGVIVLESAMHSDDLSKELYLTDLTSPYDDELFEYSDKQSKRSIAEAFMVPSILVGDQGESVFANSGDLLKTAKEIMWQSREEERLLLERSINMLLNNFKDQAFKKEYLEIKSNE